MQIEASASDLIQGLADATIANHLMLMKSLVTHGVIDGEALVDTLQRLAEIPPTGPASAYAQAIFQAEADNLSAFIAGKADVPAAPVFTVIEGGRAD